MLNLLHDSRFYPNETMNQILCLYNAESSAKGWHWLREEYCYPIHLLHMMNTGESCQM